MPNACGYGAAEFNVCFITDLSATTDVEASVMTIHSHTKKLPWMRAWITGAGRGIGAAVVTQLCRGGVEVHASSRSEPALLELAASLGAVGGSIKPMPLDICDRSQINALVRYWDQADCWPDLVVLNAGTHDPFAACEFTAERSIQLLNTNLYGTLNCLEPILRRFITQDRGQIAVMASVAGYRGLPTAAAYGASKAALINLCEALRLDLTGSHVKLQVVCPGFVRTSLTDANEFPMPALMEPDDAAERVITGLLSDRFEIVFPKRFVYGLKLLRILPYSWYFKLIEKITRARRTG